MKLASKPVVTADYSLADNMPDVERQAVRRETEQKRRENEQVDRFIQQVDTCFLRMVQLYRQAETDVKTMKSESDLDRDDIPAAYDLMLILDITMDNLTSADIEKQYEALQTARRYELIE